MMKFVIPNPTYPAVDAPLGYSTLADSISVIHNKSFGVVPDKPIYRDFIEDMIGVNITYDIFQKLHATANVMSIVKSILKFFYAFDFT